MAKTISIRGKDYQVSPNFSNLHLGVLQNVAINASSLNFDLELQSQAGQVLKEVFFKDLPDNIVAKVSENRYHLLLDIEELTEVANQLSEIYLSNRIEESQQRGDTAKEETYKQRLQALKSSRESPPLATNLAQISQQIERLKSSQSLQDDEKAPSQEPNLEQLLAQVKELQSQIAN